MPDVGQIETGDDGRRYVFGPDGMWSPLLETPREKPGITGGEFAKRVVTQDIPRAAAGVADFALSLPGRLQMGLEPQTPVSDAIAPATESGIPEEALSPGQRLVRDTAVGAATAVPFLAAGGPAIPTILGGAGGGAGAGVARDMGAGPLGQAAAGVVTGGLASLTPGASGAAGRALVAEGSAAERAAAGTLATAVQDRSAALGGLELPPRPGTASLGAATGDVGVQTLEAQMARAPLPQVPNGPPGFAARLAAQREGAMGAAEGQLAPFTQGSVDDARAALRPAVDEAVGKLRATGVGANPNEASSKVYEAVNATAKEVYAPIKGRLEAYGAKLEQSGVRFQPTRTRAALAALKKNAVFNQLIELKQAGEGQILGLIDDVVHRKDASSLLGADGKPLAPTNVPMSFTEQDALRSYIAELTASKNPKVRFEAGKLREALDADLSAATDGAQAGTDLATYREALADYHRASVIYKRGVLEDVTNTAGTVKPETVLGRMWLKNTDAAGAGASATQLRSALGPRAQEGVDAVIADAFYASADPKTGVVDPNRLAKYTRDHSEALKAFPEARDPLVNALRTQREAERLGITKNGASIERGSLAQFVDDPDDAVAAMLRQPPAKRAQTAAKYMARFKDNPAALAGWRRTVYEHLSAPAVGESVALDPKKLRSIVADNEPFIRQVWGDGALPTMRGIADEMERAASIPSPSAVSPIQLSPGPISGAIHSTVRLLSNRILGAPLQAVRGSEIVQGVVRQKTAIEAQRILEEAFLDPYGKGRALLLKATPKNVPRILDALSTQQTAAAAAPAWFNADRDRMRIDRDVQFPQPQE